MNRRSFITALAFVPFLARKALADCAIAYPKNEIEAEVARRLAVAPERSVFYVSPFKTPPKSPWRKLAHDIEWDRRFLQHIAEVETNNNQWKIGRHGERSVYQFKRSTWSQYVNLPFYYASQDRRLATTVAYMHLDWLRENLGPEASWYNLALAWHYGLDGMRGRSNDDYANRVVNLLFS